ncbi:molybdopterin-synthase adenylyltransferase MoeB [Ramlibacter sp. AW1]|uniref:Molybdopterin-synthase adenylyltransferase n=1 Tax=Ramlibacter aurantiacus TaxID=2801330 RepID=A0A937D4A6_9BURK|nr:molybdopterin-synthase adenylyltransferase MoeB [Ramlibacter aurantiacus]
MTNDQLLRYSRHILLDEIGVEGQERLARARALVIGAGGLGSPVALYLASAGVSLTLVDADAVDLTNLQRQIAHNVERLGQAKVDSARVAALAINPEVDVRALELRADAKMLDELVPASQVVLDCTDNFDTRHAINAACMRHGVPLVSGAAIRFDGQVSVFDPREASSPCYACVFPPSQAVEEARCATMGVFAPLVGIIGSTQAAEALKLLAGTGRPLTGRLLMLDALRMNWSEIRVPRDRECPVCADRAGPADSALPA